VGAGTSGGIRHRTRRGGTFRRRPIGLSAFASKEREADVTFDLARAWAQAEGSRDGEALRALDAADRLAPLRIRNDPIARDLVFTLDRRARHRVWELDSLRNHFGMGARLHSGDN
jgi:hypothetical protein